MSFTPYNAPLLSGLLGDNEVAAQFSVKAEIAAMLRFEIALTQAEAGAGVISNEAAEAITKALQSFEPDVKALGESAPRDGLIVPELIRQLRSAVGEPHGKSVHFGSTSQDVIDTSLVLRLVTIIEIFETRLQAVLKSLQGTKDRFGQNAMMGRTRMQAALPIKVAERIELWQRPLIEHSKRLEALKPQLLKVQFGGPVGTLEKLGQDAQSVRDQLAGLLGLKTCDYAWQTDRSSISDFAHWTCLVTGALGKMGQDIALMAQQGIAEVKIKGGGGSSAMPHKQNPIKAEVLVTLAKFNATQASGLSQAIHEQERSGIAWSLEWMLVPQICVATGASLRIATELLTSIEGMGSDSSS